MKKSVILLTIAMSLGSCSQKDTGSIIKPIPVNPIDNQTDITIAAAFTSDDFDWTSRQLKITVYTEDRYETEEINRLRKGDLLVFNGDSMVVTQLENKEGILTVNNGLEEGGALLQACDNKSYRGMLWDDHSTYTRGEEVVLPLAGNFSIIDCGDDPDTPSDSIQNGQRAYIESLEAYRREFTPLSTTVRIENGIITRIVRIWIP